MSSIQFEEFSGNGVLTLNRPEKLNVLNEELVEAAMAVFEQGPLENIYLFGEGERAFCAGGDVVDVVNKVKQGRPWDFFFKKEYHLDRSLHHFPGGSSCFAHGIVMGGGMGLLQACKERVVTADALLSMPEITIGFFPDVGASYFLQKVPRHWRVFMALTGARVPGTWAKELGLADRVITRASFELVRRNYREGDFDIEVVEAPLDLTDFNQCDSELKALDSLEDIESFDEWVRHYEKGNKWIKEGLQRYEGGSPFSKVLIWDQLQWAQGKSVDEAFEKDLFYAQLCYKGGDFSEGVRALLIDKDKRPRWKHQSLRAAKDEFKTLAN